MINCRTLRALIDGCILRNERWIIRVQIDEIDLVICGRVVQPCICISAVADAGVGWIQVCDSELVENKRIRLKTCRFDVPRISGRIFASLAGLGPRGKIVTDRRCGGYEHLGPVTLGRPDGEAPQAARLPIGPKAVRSHCV